MRSSGLGLTTTLAKAGWVDGARAEGRRVTKWVAEYGLARDGEMVKSELQTLAGVQCLGQNSLEIPADIRLSTAKIIHFAPRVAQQLTRFVGWCRAQRSPTCGEGFTVNVGLGKASPTYALLL